MSLLEQKFIKDLVLFSGKYSIIPSLTFRNTWYLPLSLSQSHSPIDVYFLCRFCFYRQCCQKYFCRLMHSLINLLMRGKLLDYNVVYQFPNAAITNYYQRGGLRKATRLFSCISGGQKSRVNLSDKTKVLTGWVGSFWRL